MLRKFKVLLMLALMLLVALVLSAFGADAAPAAGGLAAYMTPETLALVATLAWGLSETLAAIPAIRANSIFELFYHILAKFLGKSPTY